MLSEAQGRLRDKFGRAITDLRVSVTDRCNYKCVYCRTGNEGAQYTELAIADYLRMVRRFVSLGVEKIRLTGGEPLLRSRPGGDGSANWRGCARLICRMEHAGRRRRRLPLDIALTTNGHLLEGLASR